MFDDDDLPQRAPAKLKDLSRLSVEELRDYIARLEAEIERARAEITAKQGVRGAAEAMFKKR